MTTVHEVTELGAAAAASAVASQGNVGALKGLRVLVVDDHPVNRTLGEAMLKDLGCQVQLACNGEEAIAMVGGGAPDLVLMDCHMPGMSGLDVARALRKSGFGRPIVAVSADVSQDNIQGVRAAGMQRVLGKPFRQRDLVQAMQAALGGGETAKDGPAAAAAPVAGPSAAPGVVPPARTSDGDGKPVFDLAVAMHLVGGKRELVARLCTLFLEQLDGSVAAIRVAIAKGDPVEQKKAAHALKGSAAVIGAQRLRELAARLESEGRDGRCCAGDLPALAVVAVDTAAAMRAFLAG